MAPLKPTANVPTAALVADLVSSRTSTDRARLHATFRAAVAAVNDDPDSGLVDPLRISLGDEFQGRFATVGAALAATLRLRLALWPDGDIRFGVGWGETTVLDEDGTQDGPAWWVARAAIDWVASAQQQGATELVRTAYRNAENPESTENPEAPSTGPGEPEITAALLCRDHLVGSLDDRSKRILIGLLAGRTQADLAAAEGISASAVSQRIRRDGIALILAAHTQLKEVR